ncbi:hydrogen peroxide-inducible genes activator [Rhodopila sp.]|uniref:hydrogen peroxide-inducible genes activator n=1 Tax=Rhodopila sp. TaxID=2480087 RepID=UPI003D0C5821
MTLQDLRYVVALADHGHFGRAAAACNIAQSTLSTQLKNLEKQLGVTLFERTTKSVSVTVVGAEIVGRARQVLADVEAIISVGQHISGPLAGGFSLGVIPTLGPYLLPWLVPALKKDYPKLRLVVREDLTAPLLERLGSHRLDAALVALPVPDDRLETLPLFDEPFWFAEPKGRKPVGAKVMTEDDLHGQRLLLLTEGHCLREQALAICETADRDSEGDFRATSLQTILQMVATGLGSTLLPAMACGEARAHSVTTRPLEPGVGRRIGLAWRRSYPRLGDIHHLAKTLRDHLPQGVHRI